MNTKVVTNMLHYYLKYGFLMKIMQNVSYRRFFLIYVKPVIVIT